MNTTTRIDDVQVCTAVRDAQAPWPAAALLDKPAQLLRHRTGHPMDACKHAVNRAYDDGQLQEGVSNSRPALTDVGTALLAGGTH